MNDTTDPSEQRTPPQHGNQDTPDAPDLPFRPPRTTDDGWEYYKRGPRLLASIGDKSWTSHATRERLAGQNAGQDGTSGV